MRKDGFLSMKTLSVALCLLFIVSLGLNLYYFNTVKSDESNNRTMYKYYMEMHANTFLNALTIAGGQKIQEYIKDPESMSNIIEGVELAEFQYLVAAKYAPEEKSILMSRTLINGYLVELRNYRAFLSDSNKKNSYGINRIYTDIDDLNKIAIWIKKNTNNTDNLVYTDQDFYRDVYPLLQSDLKKNFFH